MIALATAYSSELLKKETKSLHAATEQVLLQQIRSMQSVSDYIAMLSMLYAYFAPLEDAVRRFLSPDVLPDIEHRKRAHLLLQDAALLGLQLNTERPRHLPAITHIAQAFGVLYVLEGSSLGGLHIAAMLEKKLPQLSGALAYFKGYGEHTSALWLNFKKGLDEWVQTKEEKEAALAAANQTFELMKVWMEACRK